MAAPVCRMHGCSRPATVRYGGANGEEPDLCEQHARDLDLVYQLESYEIAREYLSGFAQIAKAAEVDALDELVDLALAECELRLAAMEAERRVLWD